MPPDTGPALNIQQPPSGSLSSAQLDAIAVDIRRLEARPLAAGATEGRSALMNWLRGSPNVDVILCTGVVGRLLDSNSRYQVELMSQFMLSSAAYQIENPNASSTEVNVGGFEGALASYRIMLAHQGRSARDSYMESIGNRSEAGTLNNYVSSRGC